ncbi:Kinase, AGC Akt [Giardia muris]|uniref:Kinase, AGC Akt n=1 Tax=Giardia muris TaxID=5742 RepID=A0A4Z1SRU0_GIAMU|nr:Kinase, AGC Akt [Giardia muris]|eukprot:TNJ26358.1 Kinase, AGC Akt [Giardia muris]
MPEDVKLKFDVIKTSSRGKRQQRSLVFTTKAIQNVAGNTVQWERPAPEVHGLHRATREPKAFVLSFLTTYRFDMESAEQVAAVTSAFQKLGLGGVYTDDAVVNYVLAGGGDEDERGGKGRDGKGEEGKEDRDRDRPPRTTILDDDLDENIEYVRESKLLAREMDALPEREVLEGFKNPVAAYKFIRPPIFPQVPASHARLMRPQNFELVSTVGKGSFGKVFLVRRVDDNRFFAMKVLKKRNILDRRQLEHLKAEHNILQSFQHPNMVKLYHSFQTRTRIFLVTNFATGGELFHHLKKIGRFPEPLAVFYLAQIVLVVEYLHKHDIVFRDMKPENLLLDNHGNILLTDFGLSKTGISADDSGAGGVCSGSFCGTPDYLSGEIISGVPHGKMVDIWALGALLFEMLVGSAPFSFASSLNTNVGNSRSELYRRILKNTIVFPSYVSPECKDFVVHCLARRPKDRLNFEAIRKHRVFLKHKIDFDKLFHKEITPPFKPKLDPSCVLAIDGKLVKNPADNVYKYVSPDALVVNFDPRFTSEPPSLTSSTPADGVSIEEDKFFKEFAWTAQDAFDKV